MHLKPAVHIGGDHAAGFGTGDWSRASAVSLVFDIPSNTSSASLKTFNAAPVTFDMSKVTVQQILASTTSVTVGRPRLADPNHYLKT